MAAERRLGVVPEYLTPSGRTSRRGSASWGWWTSTTACPGRPGFGGKALFRLGYDVTVEESSSHGRPEMAMRAGGHVYLFEFKVAEMAPPGSALAQLQERGYADKYRATGEPVHLVGVEFSRASRNGTPFEVAEA